MLRHPHRHHHDLDFWPWAPLSSFPALDRDMRHLMDVLWTAPSSTPSSYCDSNGVLTLTPTYRVDARHYHSSGSPSGGGGGDDKKTGSSGGMNIEVDIPGVRKEAVALEAQGNRLKLVAAKYSPDGRSAWCSRRRRKKKTDVNDGAPSGKKNSSNGDDVQQQQQQQQNGGTGGGDGGKILPSIVYKLHLRISSKADVEQARASYRGDGVLLISIPYKTEDLRKISINIED